MSAKYTSYHIMDGEHDCSVLYIMGENYVGFSGGRIMHPGADFDLSIENALAMAFNIIHRYPEHKPNVNQLDNTIQSEW